MTRLPEPVRAYFEHLNADDWDAFGDLWTDDAELRAVGFRPCRGRQEVLAYYPSVLRSYRSHHDEVTRAVDAGETVTVEIHFHGETTEGRPVEFDAVDVFDLRDGRIRALSSWYDTALVARMVRGEVAPAGGGGAA